MDELTNLGTSTIEVGGSRYEYYPVRGFEGAERLPYSLTVLLENVLRNARNDDEANRYAQRILKAGLAGEAGEEVEFAPARVLFQDFTGVPVFVDFAVMRDACVAMGGDPAKINRGSRSEHGADVDGPFRHRRRVRLRWRHEGQHAA